MPARVRPRMSGNERNSAAVRDGRLPKRASAATTRVTSSVPAEWTRDLLVRGQLVASPESALSYRVERLLGAGGFGQVYLATRLGRSSSVPTTVCIKVSTN